jgi:hypothetical protein
MIINIIVDNAVVFIYLSLNILIIKLHYQQ